nr:RNA 2',3'-cyclic phosphodiesterase [Rosenbergiella australiborealis]
MRNSVPSPRKTANCHYFFALTLPNTVAEQIVNWRSTALPADEGRPVAKEHLYMVLAWMTQPSMTQLAQLHSLTESLRPPAFSFTLNDAGYWSRSGQVWVGCRPAPRGLLQLAELLRSRAARVGCPQPSQPFHPHITLLRQANPSLTLAKPDFSWPVHCRQFSLLSSRYHQGRVILNTEHDYPLFGNNN